MKPLITEVKKRKFFQLEEIGNFRKELDDLADLNALPASDIIRMLIHREHSAQFNGNGHDPSASPAANGEAGSTNLPKEE